MREPIIFKLERPFASLWFSRTYLGLQVCLEDIEDGERVLYLDETEEAALYAALSRHAPGGDPR